MLPIAARCGTSWTAPGSKLVERLSGTDRDAALLSQSRPLGQPCQPGTIAAHFLVPCHYRTRVAAKTTAPSIYCWKSRLDVALALSFTSPDRNGTTVGDTAQFISPISNGFLPEAKQEASANVELLAQTMREIPASNAWARPGCQVRFQPPVNV
jgi:hypothetical protein